MHPGWLGVVCGGLALVVRPSPSAAQPAPDKASVSASDPNAVSRDQHTTAIGPGRRALAISGSVVPGVLVHGSGSWLAGNSRTGWDLFALQGVGLGLFAAGG